MLSISIYGLQKHKHSIMVNIFVSTTEYYTAGKKNDLLKFVGKWIDLETIILSEVTQTQKEKYHLYSLISGF